MKDSFFQSFGRRYLVIAAGVILLGVGFLLGIASGYFRSLHSNRFIERDKVTSLATYAIKATGNIEVRKGAGIDYPIFYRLKMGEVVKLMDKGDGWSLVELQNGRMGYVSNEYLTETDISVSVIKSGWVLEAAADESNHENHEWQPKIQLLVLNLTEKPITDLKIKAIYYRENEIWAEDTEPVISPSRSDPPLTKGDSKIVFLQHPIDYNNFEFTTWVDTGLRTEIYASLNNQGFQLINSFDLPKAQYP